MVVFKIHSYNACLSGILTQHANHPRADLFYVGYLWQVRQLGFEIVFESADVERLVDLAVAASMLVGSFVFHLS